MSQQGRKKYIVLALVAFLITSATVVSALFYFDLISFWILMQIDWCIGLLKQYDYSCTLLCYNLSIIIHHLHDLWLHIRKLQLIYALAEVLKGFDNILPIELGVKIILIPCYPQVAVAFSKRRWSSSQCLWLVTPPINVIARKSSGCNRRSYHACTPSLLIPNDWKHCITLGSITACAKAWLAKITSLLGYIVSVSLVSSIFWMFCSLKSLSFLISSRFCAFWSSYC
jgi:hypothetical protein